MSRFRSIVNFVFRVLVLSILLFVPDIFAQQNFNIYGQGKIVGETWFEFEPGEEFFFEGSDQFLLNASEMKYYPTVANFFSFFDKSENSLGFRFSWDRWGNHIVDIIPKETKIYPYKFLAENLISISLWVWSPGYNHDLAAIFTRLDGQKYSLKITKLNFRGWKKFTIPIPVSVRNAYGDSVNRPKKYYFYSFRIYTNPEDVVGNVYVFFDKMDIVKELYNTIYDGIEIERLLRDEQPEIKNQKTTTKSETPKADQEEK